MIPEEYESLMLKAFSGTATAEEKSALSAWIDASLENRKAYDDFYKLFHLNDDEVLPEFDSDAEWRRLEHSISGKRETTSTGLKELSWLRVAATVLLLAASIFLVREMVRERNIIHESGDDQMVVKLHDGSTIVLKPHTTLTHSTAFNDQSRQVSLQGDAYFDVMSGNPKPFIITADQSSVQVVGTAFMVSANPSREDNIVEVMEGVVKVSFIGSDGETMRLSAGEKAVLDKKSRAMVRKKISTDNILGWRDKKLVFKKTSLDEVVDVVERYFDVKILVTNPLLLDCRFTSTFNDPSVEEVMEALSVSLDMDVLLKDGAYTFDGEGCK
jgi:transmembrane sensor